MKKTRSHRLKQAIKATVAKPVVAAFAAFTLFTAGPMLSPRKARAIESVMCSSYDQDKIVNRYLNLPDKKKTKVEKWKTLLTLKCLGEKRMLKATKKLVEVLLSIANDKDNAISLYALDVMKRMDLSKSQMGSMSQACTMQLLDYARDKFKTETASKSIMLIFDYSKQSNSIPEQLSFKFFGRLNTKAAKNMIILRAGMLLYFGAQKDAKKAVKELVAHLNDKNSKVRGAAAHTLYAYIVGYSFPDKVKLDKNLKSKVEKLLSRRKKEIYRLMYGGGPFVEFENYLAITSFRYKEQDYLLRKLMQEQQYYILRYSHERLLRMSDKEIRYIYKSLREKN
jgi:hypothetical protein